MYRTLHAIVLGTTRHSDRVSIINLYTREYGRMPVVVSVAGSSRAVRMRRAALMPLSVIEAEVNIMPDRELQRLGRFSLSTVNNGIAGNPVKSAVALFVCDFLSRLLRESPADAALWQYMVSGIGALDTMERPSNFHITFISRLTSLLGIEPDTTDYTPDAIFDMREGMYVDYPPLHTDVLRGEENRWPVLLQKIDYSNCGRLRIDRNTRRQVLAGLLRYYAIHNPGIDLDRSLEVLRSLFD